MMMMMMMMMKLTETFAGTLVTEVLEVLFFNSL
jgi:hypothetical protein